MHHPISSKYTSQFHVSAPGDFIKVHHLYWNWAIYPIASATKLGVDAVVISRGGNGNDEGKYSEDTKTLVAKMTQGYDGTPPYSEELDYLFVHGESRVQQDQEMNQRFATSKFGVRPHPKGSTITISQKAIFKDATPNEIYLNLWSSKQTDELKTGLRIAIENRKKLSGKSCAVCS